MLKSRNFLSKSIMKVFELIYKSYRISIAIFIFEIRIANHSRETIYPVKTVDIFLHCLVHRVKPYTTL